MNTTLKSNDYDQNNQRGRIVSYNYKNTIKINHWEEFLDRKLEQEEILILQNAESEKRMNDKILHIYEIAKSSGLYVPELTNMHGNCLFESFQYHDLCPDVDDFRCGIAFLMIMFKDLKGIIPAFPKQSMEELSQDFMVQDTIVFCRKKRRAYKYNFVAMCIDLAINTSWTRINTHLVLAFISALLNVKIQIIHNGTTSYVSTIGEGNKFVKTIYLGLIDEVHYFPLAERTGNDDIENICPKYVDSLKIFHQWAKGVSIVANKVTYEHDII